MGGRPRARSRPKWRWLARGGAPPPRWCRPVLWLGIRRARQRRGGVGLQRGYGGNPGGVGAATVAGVVNHARGIETSPDRCREDRRGDVAHALFASVVLGDEGDSLGTGADEGGELKAQALARCLDDVVLALGFGAQHAAALGVGFLRLDRGLASLLGSSYGVGPRLAGDQGVDPAGRLGVAGGGEVPLGRGSAFGEGAEAFGERGL